MRTIGEGAEFSQGFGMKSLNKCISEISILYVEDEAGIREMLSKFISMKFPALKLLTAENGKVGLEMFNKYEPDIVLTDVCMPIMDGIRMAGEIRALNANANIIVITARSDTRFLMEAIKIGINRYVLKPIDNKKLSEAIEDCIARINLERQVKGQHEFILKLSAAVEQSPSMVIITDAKGAIEYVNPKFTGVTGYMPEEVIGQNPRILKTDATPPETFENLWSTITAGREWHGEFINRKKNGEHYYEAASISPLVNGEGVITHFVAVKEDITDKKCMEQTLRESEAQYRSIFEESIDGVLLVSSDGHILEANPEACGIFGRTVDEMRRSGRAGIIDENDPQFAAALERWAMSGKFKGELTGVRRDGTTFPVEVSSSIYVGRNGRDRTSIIVRDITERKHAEDKLRYVSSHDALTGLYNRAFFQEEMERLQQGRQFPVSIVVADVDRLKIINDKLGHAAGDELLVRAALALKGVFRAEDVVARTGGDEFAVLLPMADKTVVEEALQRLSLKCSAYGSDESQNCLSMSFGAATAIKGDRLEETLKLADKRMYEDKFAKKRHTP